MRVAQPEGKRGSLKWLQRAIEHRPDLLQPAELARIEWISPIRADDFAEYRDGDFLSAVGLPHLTDELSAFWPKRGPQWDALGRVSNTVVLVEAKAHIGEFLSPPSQASAASRAKIDAAFGSVRAALGVTTKTDWAEVFFQYANRIAHLWFLREKGVSAELLFVSFLNDTVMDGPSTAETWEAAFAVANHALGLGKAHGLARHIRHIYPDARLL